MNRSDYYGKMCPYCKTKIEQSDDIVICSICNMPHHKECWVENQGCTTFGCTGSIMNPDGEIESQNVQKEDVVINNPSNVHNDISTQSSPANIPAFCSKCGAKRKANSSYCRICGIKFMH